MGVLQTPYTDTVMLLISKPVLTQKQVATGLSEDYVRWMLKLLKINLGNPRILSDIGLSHSKSQTVTQTLLNLWCCVPVTAQVDTNTIEAEDFESGETDSGGSFFAPTMDGPFDDTNHNEIWRVFTLQMIEGYKELADVDMLEPDPPNRSAAMRNVRLRPFWMQSENKEMNGLNTTGCFRVKPWK
eukprot:3640192-Rhodomonas_salina.1